MYLRDEYLFIGISIVIGLCVILRVRRVMRDRLDIMRQRCMCGLIKDLRNK